MKTLVAVQNSFPNGSHTAELEFIRRLRLCAERQSIDLCVLAWSSEVQASEAEFLLTLHEVSPKLHRYADGGRDVEPAERYPA